MKKNFKKIALTATVIAVTALAFSACGKKVSPEDKKVSYWVMLSGNASQTVKNLSETPFAQELMKEFDCTIEYQHPATGSEQEQFNLLTSAGGDDLPDIIEYKWLTYKGGPAAAIKDGVIQELDLAKDAPNLKKFVESEQGKKLGVDKMIKTDDGQYFGYPFIRGERYLQTSAGFIIREDWLDDLGLELPETVDEWETVLKEIKEKKTGGKAPAATALLADQGGFMQAYGVPTNDLYQENGKIKYGAMQDGFKDYLALMNDWYKKGYLDENYESWPDEKSKILNNEYAVMWGACGSGIGIVTNSARQSGDEKLTVTGAKMPVLNKGDVPLYGNYQNAVTGIFGCITNATIDNPYKRELCAKILDYGYAEDGIMLHNFGIEGVSYNMVDGYPTFTEDITANKDGLSMAASMARYTNSHTEAPFVQRREYMEQYAALPEQQKALENWSYTQVDKYFLPPITLTPDESAKLSTKKTDVDTYRSTEVNKFIKGELSLDKFDEFRQGLIDRGVEEVIQYYQAALDRYNQR